LISLGNRNIIALMKGHLRVTGLKFEYPSYTGRASRIFSGLSLETNPGDITVIIGGAESGKSTLALILAALVPGHTGGELSGTAVLDGLDLLISPAAEIIEKCGIIFQDPEKQTVTTDCFSEAAFALESLGIPEAEILGKVEDAFDILQIGYLAGSSTAETSGGEKKKLALAGLICVSPDLWILDETVEELDSPSRIELLEFLKDREKSVIILTSKYYDVFEKADSFYHLRSGILSERAKLPFPPEFTQGLEADGLIPDFGSGHSTVFPCSGKKLISVKDLRFCYSSGGENRITGGWEFELDIDEFSLSDGEILSIVGRNGCGKSTFGKLLCGLLIPDSGSIKASGSSGEDRPSSYLNSYCAYMFQNPDYQIFLPTIYQELSWGLTEAGFSQDEIKEKVEYAINSFDLPEPSTPPAMMSFSARKRLQAAVYYLLERPVFILDEADTGLSYRDFIRLIKQLRAVSRGIIIITHNLELAADVSDRVLGMSGGRITEDLCEFSSDNLKSWLAASALSGRVGQ
jgi:energy-coupling factor transport system ATP-binding protein